MFEVMMKSPMEVLFDTCQELMGKRLHTLQHFQAECSKDKVMGEVVTAICEAMTRYVQPVIDEWKKDHNLLQVSRLIEEKKVIELQDLVRSLESELAELKKESVIVE